MATKITLPHGEDAEFELTFTPYSEDDILLRENADGSVSLGYLVQDTDVGDFWNDRDGGELKIFRSQDERDAFIAEVEEKGGVALIVDNYSHSGDHYSLEGTRNYPDRRWDVAPRGVYVLAEDDRATWDAAIAAGGDRKAAIAAVREAVNATLDEYSKWANGEVYVHVVETFRRTGDTWEADDSLSDDGWGYIGYDYAEECLREAMPKDIRKDAERLLEMRERLEQAAQEMEEDPTSARIAIHDRIENQLGDYVETLGRDFEEVDAMTIRLKALKDFRAGARAGVMAHYDILSESIVDPDTAANPVRIYPGNLVMTENRHGGWDVSFDTNDQVMTADSPEALEPALFEWGIQNGYLDLDAEMPSVVLPVLPEPAPSEDEPDGP